MKYDDSAMIPEGEETPEINISVSRDYIYRGGTLDALSTMLDRLKPNTTIEELIKIIEKEEEESSRVLFIRDPDQPNSSGHLRYEIPDDLDRSNSILVDPFLINGLKKGQLARDYYHISPSELSMRISPRYANKVRQNMVISALLIPKKLLPLFDINHILMELGKPGLYPETGKIQTNRRNRALIKLIEYAQKHECPGERWLFVANDMLRYLGYEPLYNDANCEVTLQPELKKLFDAWNKDSAETDDKEGYMRFRRECFQRYCKSKGMTSERAQQEIAFRIQVSAETVETVLCSRRMSSKTHSSRPTLILAAIEIGCDLDEANRMLMEAEYELLYPFRESDEDREYIFRLLKNQKKREKETVQA